MNVANILAHNAGCEVLVRRSACRADGGSGNLAADTIRQFKFDIAVIGSALDQKATFLITTSRSRREPNNPASVTQNLSVSDHKIHPQRTGPHRILGDIDTVFIDRPFPANLPPYVVNGTPM